MKVLLALVVVLGTLSITGCKNANQSDTGMSGSSNAQMCSACNGSGMNGTEKCALCGGTGRK